ncbi:DeoR family transcriptional regulator [Massilibacteroides sp.]|uniref:DeoR family transcriptional regulator n=1 Tax=Massilibacteroides sp. TaxID=2034766 RepID=UPI0026045EE7|nr:DeoR family transcriptional regulator [Massilibacteroides sp.]MDD4515171.1 DeoR family transcriptional regulator [Massilibacteroides sp.]
MDREQKILALLSQFEKLGIGKQIDYDKFYLYSLITHSTAIEGSTVTEIENQLLFDEHIRNMEQMIHNYQSSIENDSIEADSDVRVNVRVKLTDRERQIIRLIKENDYITILQLATALAVHERTIRRDISNLKNQGVLTRIGADKNGIWEVTDGDK